MPGNSKTKIKQNTQCNKLSNQSKEKDIECNLRLKMSTEREVAKGSRPAPGACLVTLRLPSPEIFLAADRETHCAAIQKITRFCLLLVGRKIFRVTEWKNSFKAL